MKTDAELASAIAGGETAAWADLYDRHRDAEGAAGPRHGVAGVPAGAADELRRPVCDGGRAAPPHAAQLERPDRLVAVELQPHVRPQAGRQRLGTNQRCCQVEVFHDGVRAGQPMIAEAAPLRLHW